MTEQQIKDESQTRAQFEDLQWRMDDMEKEFERVCYRLDRMEKRIDRLTEKIDKLSDKTDANRRLFSNVSVSDLACAAMAFGFVYAILFK